MILDALLQFTATGGDSITTAATATPSTNIIDLGTNATATQGIPDSTRGGGARDIGIGDKPAMKFVVQCITAMAGGTSVIVLLQGAVDDGTGIPGSWVTWWTSPTYPIAPATIPIAAGTRLYDMDMPRPPAGVAVPRFLRMAFTSVGTFSPAARIGAWLVLDRDDQMYNSTNNAIIGGYPAGLLIAN